MVTLNVTFKSDRGGLTGVQSPKFACGLPALSVAQLRALEQLRALKLKAGNTKT